MYFCKRQKKPVPFLSLPSLPLGQLHQLSPCPPSLNWQWAFQGHASKSAAILTGIWDPGKAVTAGEAAWGWTRCSTCSEPTRLGVVNLALQNWGFPQWLEVKNLPALQKAWVQSLSQEDPWRRAWQPTPLFLPRESHGHRSLAGYSSGSQRESDVTEHTGMLQSQAFRSPGLYGISIRGLLCPCQCRRYETCVRTLDGEDPLNKKMATHSTHSSTLA